MGFVQGCATTGLDCDMAGHGCGRGPRASETSCTPRVAWRRVTVAARIKPMSATWLGEAPDSAAEPWTPSRGTSEAHTKSQVGEAPALWRRRGACASRDCECLPQGVSEELGVLAGGLGRLGVRADRGAEDTVASPGSARLLTPTRTARLPTARSLSCSLCSLRGWWRRGWMRPA